MSASRTPSVPDEIKKITIKHGLLLTQVVFTITIWVYWWQIKKHLTEQQDKVKASSVNSVLNGVVPDANPQTLCLSSSNVEDYKKLQLYTVVIFIFIIISSFVNSLYLSFQYKLPTDRWIVALVYVSLAATGIVGMALSVDGFLKIRSMTHQPSECAVLSQKFQVFFIISMSINVFQALVSLWTLKDLFYVAKKA